MDRDMGVDAHLWSTTRRLGGPRRLVDPLAPSGAERQGNDPGPERQSKHDRSHRG